MAWMKDNFLPRKLVGTLLSFLMDIHHTMSVTLCFWILGMKTTLCLPSHSTHYLQPLDRSLFKSLKHYFHEACQTCMMSNEQWKITRLKFGQILSEDLGRSATAGNGISGFRATGIHPLDPSPIPEHAFSTFQGHFANEARRLQSGTHSSQSVRVKSAPSTSDEHAGLESHKSSAH
jgi:hypothetical protein